MSFVRTYLPEQGMTVRIDVNEGSVALFGSNKIQMPNEAFYDFMLSNNRRDIFVTKSTFGIDTPAETKREITNFTNITVYISIQGQGISNNFTFNTTVGDTTTGIMIRTCYINNYLSVFMMTDA